MLLARKMKILESRLIDKFKLVNPKYYKNYKSNIEIIRKLNNIAEISKEDISAHLLNMLYSNAITSLETYLSDAFIDKIESDRKFLISFVETFKDFSDNKIKISEIFIKYSKIDDLVAEALSNIIYHQLPKVKGMYEDTFNINFPDIGSLMKAILNRHDLVHRNGKTKDGKILKIESKDIIDLCDEIETFVNCINHQLIKLK